MSPAWWAAILVVGVAATLLAGGHLANIAMTTPDVNRDARALLSYSEGSRIRVQIPGDERVGYYVRISESAYRALDSNDGAIRIGPVAYPIVVEPKP